MHSLRSFSRVVSIFGVVMIASAAHPQETSVDPKEFFQKLAGTWEGTCRTWLMPDKLHDESAVKGEFQFIFGGKMIRHTYTSGMEGKPRNGEETIALNSFSKKIQVSWIDDFHTAEGVLFSEGDPTPTGLSVTAEYSAGPGQPVWHWRTVYELTDPDHLTITAYNITPDGTEAKATETKYTRVTKD